MTTPVSMPPTDSLYKFAAILGTLVFVATVYYVDTITSNLETQTAYLEKEISITEIQSEQSQQSVEQVKKIIENSIADQNGTYKPDSSKLELRYSDDELKQMIKEKNSHIVTTQTKLAEIEYLLGETKRLSSRTWKVLIIGTIFEIIALFLAIWGYSMWYKKIQVYIDKAFRNQSFFKNTS